MKYAQILVVALLGILSEACAQTYTITTPVTGLYYPVAFDFAPDGRYFITLKGDDGGPNTNAKVVVYSAAGTLIGNFYNFTDSTVSNFERGVLGITLDPDFANNHYVYVYYNHLRSGSQALRVVRLTENNNVGTNPRVILHLPVGNINGNHVGGNIHFRPSEPTKLYVSIGEIAVPANAQSKANPFGKFLRINSDGTIPTDNPFYDDGNPSTGNDDRIWSYGHRNPFDFTFSPVSDTMYSSENGANTFDEVNVVTRGRNYGWQQCEGNNVYGSTTNLCQNVYPSHTEPISVWGAPLPALTGILYYSGTVMPEFNNHLLVSDNDYGRIYDLTLGNAPYYDVVTSRTTWQDLPGGLTTLKQGTDGCVYAMKGGYTTTGNISRICPQGLDIKSGGKKTGMNFNVKPNPVRDNFTVTVSSEESANAEINIVDVQGNLVASLFTGKVTASPKTLEFGSENYSNGIYFVRLFYTTEAGDQESIVKKVVID